MHDTIFLIAVVWLIALAGWTVIIAARTTVTARQLVALDTLSYLLVTALVVLAIHREEAAFLDIALAIAALGFIQTVAVAGLATGREARR